MSGRSRQMRAVATGEPVGAGHKLTFRRCDSPGESRLTDEPKSDNLRYKANENAANVCVLFVRLLFEARTQ
jgi:hypothetical protein